MITEALFWFFAILAASSALLTVTRRSPVASALWLIGTFFCLAAIYTLLGALFIGVVQVLVYAGAIMVLFLFVIMLLNLGNDFEPDVRSNAWKVAGGVSAAALVALLASAFTRFGRPPLGAHAGGDVLEAALREDGVVGIIALPLYEQYVVPLQATAILLLIAVVGAVVLAKRDV